MPKLAPFALMDERPPRKARPQYLIVFLLFFAIPLFLIHLPLLSLPYFWDELGQFVPTALDLLRSGTLVAHSTIPNVHPVGVEAYLALCYKLFGFSVAVTRVAMLALGACGLLLTFLLAIELSRGTKGAPAFLPPILLLISPLFYTQSMLAQLDMPAMVFTLLALLLFVRGQYGWAAVACVALVLVKETGIVTPFVFCAALAFKKDWKRAGWFAISAVVLVGWLVLLHAKTGYWLGDAAFGQYNVSYALNPIRMGIALLRRLFYLFCGDMRWIGTLVVILTAAKCKAFHTREWAVVAAVGGVTIILVSIFGGAELERYVLPVLPLFYIAVSVGLTTVRKPWALAATAALIAGLVLCIRWNPPYPVPFENNYAMVDFVHLQQAASAYAEHNLRDRRIATAWPYTAGLRNADLGYVEHGMKTVETGDLHYASVKRLPAEKFDTLIAYTREWAPGGLTENGLVQQFLKRFYQWAPDITAEQCEELGLREKVSWSLGGQRATVYIREPIGKPVHAE
jgi:hypothetical protein